MKTSYGIIITIIITIIVIIATWYSNKYVHKKPLDAFSNLGLSSSNSRFWDPNFQNLEFDDPQDKNTRFWNPKVQNLVVDDPDDDENYTIGINAVGSTMRKDHLLNAGDITRSNRRDPDLLQMTGVGKKYAKTCNCSHQCNCSQGCSSCY